MMTLETKKFARKPFYVDAVQVTAENIEQVAKWCQGVIEGDSTSGNYIKVRVHRPLNERQTKAFVGDWVLYAGTGYKVYTNKAFWTSFESTTSVDEHFETVPQDEPATVTDIRALQAQYAAEQND